jgi:hypothetical protein
MLAWATGFDEKFTSIPRMIRARKKGRQGKIRRGFYRGSWRA